jgi:hypothetical protein
MPTPDEIAESIATAATQPASASVDGNSVTQRSLREQIEAANYIASRTAAAQNRFGLRFSQIVPPGTG